MSLGVAAVVLAATFAIATAALQFVKTSMRESIAQEEFARVSALADAVDQKFISRRTLLKTFGDSAEALRVPDAAPLQAFLERHTSLREAFDNVAFIDMDGNLVANLNNASQVRRVNVKDRAYFRDTVASRAGVISEPYRNRLNGLAQVAITEPVLDSAGRVQFVISGSINLKERNILGELASVRFGETGYLFITTTNGIVVDHPREERVLEAASPDTARNPEIERAIAGFEGATEGVNRAGVHGLYAFRRLRQADWIMGAMYPRDEAFARVDAIERAAWAGAFVLALLAGGIALAVVRRQLKPLTALHRHMLDAQAAPAEVAALRTYTNDEIGDLSRTFDRLIRQRQADEKFLRDITDNLPAMVSHADAQGRYTFVNARLCEKLGQSAAQLIGQPVQSMRSPGDDAALEAGLRRVAAGESVSLERRDTSGSGAEERFFQTDLIPDLDNAGQYRGYYAMTFDVTERKRIEVSLAHSEAKVRIIADNIPALVSHVDASLNYTFVNAHIRALHQNDSMVGQSMPEARGAADFAIVEPYIRRALAGETVVIEKKGDPARGIGERTYKAHYIPDQDASGAVQGVFAMTFDITDEVNVRKALTEQEKRLRDVTDSIPALVGYFDTGENCLYANSRARQMAGHGDRPLDGVTLRSALGESMYAQHAPYIPVVLAGKQVRFPLHAPLHGKDGHFQAHLVPDKDLGGRVLGFYLMTFNITALKQAELQRADSENRLRTITDNLPALITYIDREENVTFANATHREWLGLDPSQLLDRPLHDVVGAGVYRKRKAMIDRALAGERVEFEDQTGTGGTDRVTRVSLVPDIGADGSTHGIFSLCLDITALKAVESQLIELARLDTLTGLPNRLAFNELLPAALLRAQRTGSAMALMFLDIDAFKTINDTLGHASGDSVLAEYANRLRSSVRATDTVARLAGDEFVVVLENLPARDAAAAVAQKILAQIRAPAFRLDSQRLQVTTSIGIAFRQGGDAPVTAEELLAHADSALYAAKSAGRNRFEFFSD
ncbi:diguanylate cyclase (GGDEF)-like protein/PAS domain S-box-containing protein [Variovorax boronicumulans]|uniref:sensor domain-containing diguanylate cyclase n=1 Tax=Variovorax boronicumulans TaxID=436515 RepID=UPI002785D538|nr:PAS domain-containing protein [Variovorax boronicumulans]MDQ0013881.1 diguanylate cyclase (GGDEF)-like protein/PAS domain S-box-containing protein [Variovorax boronicumulans]